MDVKPAPSVFLGDLRIRPVRNSGEADELHRIERLSYPSEIAASREAFRYRSKHFRDFFLVAEYRGNLVGVITGVRTGEIDLSDERLKTGAAPAENGPYFCILTVAVLPAFRKRGIGSKLVSALTEQVRSHGLKGIGLMCERHLIPFYERAGFRYTGPCASRHGGISWHEMRLLFRE